MSETNQKITIEIANITKAQAIAIEDMLATWVRLGQLGSSRWTSFFADGDGNFRPHVTVNGCKAKHTHLLSKEDRWSHAKNNPDHETPGEYRIDYDKIAWKLRAEGH